MFLQPLGPDWCPIYRSSLSTPLQQCGVSFSGLLRNGWKLSVEPESTFWFPPLSLKSDFSRCLSCQTCFLLSVILKIDNVYQKTTFGIGFYNSLTHYLIGNSSICIPSLRILKISDFLPNVKPKFYWCYLNMRMISTKPPLPTTHTHTWSQMLWTELNTR